MSFLSNLLTGIVGQQLVSGLSKQTGAESSKVASVIAMAAPFILSQMSKNAQSKSGADSLSKALDKHSGSVLDDISGLLNSPNMADGLGILGHVFGNKQNHVAQNISKQSGVSAGNVMQILATLAPIIMAFLGKQKQQNNLDSNGVSSLLGGLLGGVQQDHKSEMSFIEKILDQDNDGNVADDVMDLGSKLLGGLFK